MLHREQQKTYFSFDVQYKIHLKILTLIRERKCEQDSHFFTWKWIYGVWLQYLKSHKKQSNLSFSDFFPGGFPDFPPSSK